MCPDSPNVGLSDPSLSAIGPVVSYAANGYFTPVPNDWHWQVHGVISVSGPDVWWINGSTGIADASVHNPAGTVMLSENDPVYPNASAYIKNLAHFGPDSIFTGVNWWDGLGLIPNGSLAPTFQFDPNGQNGSVMPVHNGMANFLFCDGHVKSMNPAATNPNPTNQPQNNMWDALR
jgi:prepilin-type processing-associated H-X9-DG protein